MRAEGVMFYYRLIYFILRCGIVVTMIQKSFQKSPFFLRSKIQSYCKQGFT